MAFAGATVAKAICTPLRKQDSIVLYDAATGQKLQSSCREFPFYTSSGLTQPLPMPCADALPGHC